MSEPVLRDDDRRLNLEQQVGGVRVARAASPWRWDDARQRPVLRES